MSTEKPLNYIREIIISSSFLKSAKMLKFHSDKGYEMFKPINSKTIKVTYQQKDFELSAKLKEYSREFIVFIHGLGCNKESFVDVWNFLCVIP